MDILQIENTAVAIILIILAALIPIGIIWFTIRQFRKKRERKGEGEGESRFGKKFKSVKEERLEKSGRKEI